MYRNYFENSGRIQLELSFWNLQWIEFWEEYLMEFGKNCFWSLGWFFQQFKFWHDSENPKIQKELEKLNIRNIRESFILNPGIPPGIRTKLFRSSKEISPAIAFGKNSFRNFEREKSFIIKFVLQTKHILCNTKSDEGTPGGIPEIYWYYTNSLSHKVVKVL